MINRTALDTSSSQARGEQQANALDAERNVPGPNRQSVSSAHTVAVTAQQQQDVHNRSNNEGPDNSNWSEDEDGGTRVAGIYIPPPVQPYCSTESKGPRLIIKKIENFNFKSYAGKVVLGPFHQCFTAIIGPNGSGKSNVIDSMLFVFGYRANKIRCKKLSTLLHNSAKFPNCNSCSVAVHFVQIIDRENGTCEDVPNSEIVISRTAFRDNSSYYEVNGKKVQFREVARILKHHNVDLDHNRFLILQGEVESIAMMKPKALHENECGMLEYLEDIVGTSRYKEPLKQINERVSELTDERTQKHNRCTLAEREMKDLEKPYNDALEYLRLENENTRTKNIRVQKYLNDKMKKFEEYSKELETINLELKDHDASDMDLQTKRKEKEVIIQEELKYFEKLRTDKENIEKRLEKANSSFTEIQQLMTVKNQQRKKSKAQLEKSQNELIELKKIPLKNEKEIEECEKKVEQLMAQKEKAEDELQENYAKLEKQTKPLIEQREALETELIDLKSAVDEAKREVTVSEAELGLLQQNELSEMRKYETLKTSYQDSEQSLNEKRAQLNETEKTLPQVVKTIAEKRAELQRLQVEEEQMTTKLRSLRNEINEKSASIQTSRSNNKVLDFLMRQKNEGSIPGILGRLGDLGGINPKYDVAISTACGRLDNIVVDTVDTAQLCIRALKENDVGRASFIALEKIYHYGQQSGPINTPENAPRLYDLVSVEDERVLPAFYFALRNTLVATDLDQGTRIAYGARRYRVVTLKGDLIETSGTMSGGGRTQIRGKMAATVQTKTKYSSDSSMATEKALEDMQVNAESLQSKINFNQEEQSRLERDLQALQRKQQELEANVQKLSITIKSLMEQLPRISDQVEKQKHRMMQTKADAGQVKVLEMDIKKKQQNHDKSEEAANKVVKQINDIKEQIDKIHGDKIKVVQTNINNISNQIKKLNGNMSKLKVDITTSERNVAKLEKNIEQLQADIQKAEEGIKEMSQQRQKFDDETVQLSKDLEEAKSAMVNAKSGTSTVHDEIKEIEKLENENKLKRVEIEQRHKEMTAMRADIKSQIPHWQAQLKPLKLHEIPGETEPQAELKTYTEEELNSYNLQDIQYKESVQEELLKKKPNLSCISEYIEKRSVYLERVKVLEDITMKRNEMRKLFDDVKKKRFNEFMQGFHIITRKLKEMYQMITQGGDAELELVDSMDPFTEGVSFSVRPPKKSWKNISNLSGGEKTLSSLALVFALHYYKPSPLYFMDEIDAALDFKNISIVAHYIKERTKNAQFIIISLRSNMFELSDVLVGIYKVEDCTESLPMLNGDSKTIKLTRLQSNAEDHDNDEEDSSQPDRMTLLKNATVRESTFVPQIESTAMSQLIQDQLDQTALAARASEMFKRPMAPCSISALPSASADAADFSATDVSAPQPMDSC